MDTKDPRVLLAIDDKQDNLIALKAVIADVFPSTTLLTAQSGSEGIALALTENPVSEHRARRSISPLFSGLEHDETWQKLK